MSDILKWDPIDANNTDAPPDGWPEGMPASAVNDSARAIQGSVRRFAEDGGWFDWGHTATYVSGTVFQVPGDLSAVYTVGRRVRAAQTATIYGSIESVSVTANTDVTVAWDSGALANEALAVSLGPDKVATGSVLTGEIRIWSTATAPGGWLLCDGAEVSRTTYAALFAVVGTTYGSAGGTTFTLPDLRGRSPIGVGTSPDVGVNAIALAVEYGVSEVTLTAGESGLQNHTHPINFADNKFLGNAPGAAVGVGASYAFEDVPSATQGNGAAGANQSHQNQSPALGLNFIIAT